MVAPFIGPRRQRPGIDARLRPANRESFELQITVTQRSLRRCGVRSSMHGDAQCGIGLGFGGAGGTLSF